MKFSFHTEYSLLYSNHSEVWLWQVLQMWRIWMKSTSNCNLHLREHFNDKFCFNDWGGSWKIMIEACMNLVRLSSYKHQDNLFACWHFPPQSLKQKLTSKCSLRCRFPFEILFIQILSIWVFAKAILLNTIFCFLCMYIDIMHLNCSS